MLSILATIVSSMLIYSAPLILTAIGGTFSERSGIINVGLEGIMVVGAFIGILFNLHMAPSLGIWTPWVAALIAGVFGCIFSVIHAVATVNLRANHIVSGTVMNMLAPALTVYITKLLYSGAAETPTISPNGFGKVTIPILSDIPIIGRIFFTDTFAPAYVAIAIAFIAYFVLFKTRFGLRLRSVGEHPQAADTLGINVYKMRYAGVLISGFLGGIGGSIVAQGVTDKFSFSTIVGHGFIALAAMIFGKWHPIGVMLSALLFGLAQSLGVIGNFIPFVRDIPVVWLNIAPYIITIVVLVGFIGKAEGPAANGTTYVKSK